MRGWSKGQTWRQQRRKSRTGTLALALLAAGLALTALALIGRPPAAFRSAARPEPIPTSTVSGRLPLEPSPLARPATTEPSPSAVVAPPRPEAPALAVTPLVATTAVPTPVPRPIPTATPLPPAHDPRTLALLKGFVLPIRGARLPTYDGQLPNAPRPYRAGRHEGLDFYHLTSGAPIRIGTPVLAVQRGQVARADLDYQDPRADEMERWLARTRQLGDTPPEILDRLRGRQVWLYHGSGVVTRYAHLAGLGPGIRPGAAVEQGQIIGYVGNSGSPEAAEGTSLDPHLHFEIWIGEEYFGQGLAPEEIRRWLAAVFRSS